LTVSEGSSAAPLRSKASVTHELWKTTTSSAVGRLGATLSGTGKEAMRLAVRGSNT
jgi:hypothetical protein